MRWDEARRQCLADDADLVSILNPVTQAYLTLQISNLNEPLWIGLNNNVVKSLTNILGSGTIVPLEFLSENLPKLNYYLYIFSDRRSFQVG